MSDQHRQTADSGPPRVYEPPAHGVEMGIFQSDAGSGYVLVERLRTGVTVKARYEGYPEGFEFQPGDETAIEWVDGGWRTIPSVVHTIRLKRRIEWWTRNRWTGEFRFLTQMRLDTGAPQGPDPVDRSQLA